MPVRRGRDRLHHQRAVLQGHQVEVTPDGHELLVYSRDVAVIRMFDIGAGNQLTARSGKKKRVVLGTATYSIKAGVTKKVTVKLSAKNQKLVAKNADARKLLLKAKVADTVGNKATIKQKAKLALP